MNRVAINILYMLSSFIVYNSKCSKIFSIPKSHVETVFRTPRTTLPPYLEKRALLCFSSPYSRHFYYLSSVSRSYTADMAHARHTATTSDVHTTTFHLPDKAPDQHPRHCPFNPDMTSATDFSTNAWCYNCNINTEK